MGTDKHGESPLDQVGIGTTVSVELETETGDREPAEFTIVRPESADFDAGFLGANTPMAKAIVGQFVGRCVPLAMGDVVAIHILRAEKAKEAAPADAAARRAAALEEARRKAERTNAEMFASSYGSKWGGYDVPDED